MRKSPVLLLLLLSALAACSDKGGDDSGVSGAADGGAADGGGADGTDGGGAGGTDGGGAGGTDGGGTGGTDGGSTDGGTDGGSTDGEWPTLLHFSGEAPKNLLFISLETLRRDHIGYYSGGDRSPFIDEILRQSVVLEDHRACSNWTYEAVGCVLTGQNGAERGWFPAGGPGTLPEAVPEDQTWMGSWLREQGYTSVGVFTNFFLSERFGLGPHYDVITTEPEARADELSAMALAHYDKYLAHTEEPWYFHLHVWDPHVPYTVPEEYYLAETSALAPIPYDFTSHDDVDAFLEEYHDLPQEQLDLIAQHLAIMYDAEVRYMDEQLSLLWAALDERGALDDTLVLIWSDHGEQFFEHGDFEHGKSLHYGETLSAAAFWAENLPAGRWAGPTAHRDLLPTTFAALGLPIPPEVSGRVIGGEGDAAEPRYALSDIYDSSRFRTISQAVDSDGLRLLYDWPSGRLELYDVAADPEETTDLYAPGSADVQALWALLEPQVSAVQAIVGPSTTATEPSL